MRRPIRFHRSPRARTASFIFLAWVTLSLITAVAGPFSTYQTMPLDVRFLYWGGIIGASIVLGEGIRRVVARFGSLGPVGADIVGSVVMGLSFGTAVTVFNDLVLHPETPFAQALAKNVVVVLLACFGVIVFRAYARHLANGEGATADPQPRVRNVDAVPGFLRDLDPEIGRSVRWIEADDHYLRVHAAKGSVRVLKRFRDALEELADVPGLRVHRSHWVRIEAVTEVRTNGRRHVAVLGCGTEVPVSRSYLGDLKAAGLMPRDGASARR